MLIIGSHVGFKKNEQLLGSLMEALSYGCNTFMFYTGAPQNTARYEIDDRITYAALAKMKEVGMDYSKVIVHAPYIVNLANKTDISKFNFAVDFLKQEVERCSQLGIKKLVLHPGSHVGQGVDVGIKNIADGLNKVLEENSDVMILLETMAGKGTEIGSNFEELKRIIDDVVFKEKIGICMDTCHLHDSGYDISKFDDILNKFDKIVGLSFLKCIHVNDSKNPRGARKDRHENIGYGQIGFENLMKIIYNEKLDGIPKILETPYVNDKAPYAIEIKMIKDKEFIDFK